MRTAVVTGAGGFIGGALTRRLLDEGVKVYGVDISEKALLPHIKNENFTPVIADFSKYPRLHEMIEVDIDVFYHFAWQGVFGEAFKDYQLQLDNAKHACEAMEQAIKIGCKKFVYAGTYNEYEIKNFLNSEKFEPRYTCIYSGAKTVAEVVCKTLAYNNGIEYSAGLVAMAYGEGNRSMMLPNVVMRQLLTGQTPKLIKGDNLYDLIYIDDIAEAFYRIGERGKNLKSYYVGHRKLKTFRELLTELGEIVNPNIELKFGEYKDTDNKDYSLIDLDALYNDTDFECRADFKESIMKTANYIKNEFETEKSVGGG